MTVSAADAAGVALPAAGNAGKRAAEGADVFAALVAGLLGSLVAPGDGTGQQDQPGDAGAQGQPGSAGELAVGAIGAAPAATGVAVPAVPAALSAPAVLTASIDPAVAAAPQGVAPATPPSAPTLPEQSEVQAPAAQALATATPDGAAPAQEGTAASAARQPLPEQPEVPAATTLPVAAPVAAATAPVVQDVAAVAPTVAATPTPAAPAAQVAAVVSPVLQGPDGSYRVTMHLHPEELGRVAVTVDLHQGSVSMHLHAADTGTGALLRDSLDDLRAELDRQGLSAGNLDVSSGDGGPGGQTARELLRETPRTDSADSDAVAASAPGIAVHPTAGRPSALDVQL